MTSQEKAILQYIRHYPEWVNYIETLADARQAIQYKPDKIQTSLNDDEVFELAIKIDAYQEKIDKVERCLRSACITDKRTSQMRRALCYGEKQKISPNEFYSLRRQIARYLMEVFKEGSK